MVPWLFSALLHIFGWIGKGDDVTNKSLQAMLAAALPKTENWDGQKANATTRDVLYRFIVYLADPFFAGVEWAGLNVKANK
jgi:hypothetical protein